MEREVDTKRDEKYVRGRCVCVCVCETVCLFYFHSKSVWSNLIGHVT